jgi:hypothetical protein
VTLWTALGWAASAGSLATLFGVIAWMLLRRRRVNAVECADGSVGFKPGNYGPMECLLAEEDFLFLQAQPGYRPEMGARWKRERRRIFRLYLAELKHDFRRLHAEARTLVAHSPADSSDLVGVLMRQQWTFLRATAGLEIHLALEWAGIAKVDAAPLIELLEAMRVDLAHRTALHAA